MAKFTVIPQDTFETMQYEAGVILSAFNPDPAEGEDNFTDEDVLCATTGDIGISVKPDLVDMGKEINNCPTGMAELMKNRSWTAQLRFTTPKLSAKLIALGLGPAEVSGNKITVRDIKFEDFKPIYWVGDLGNSGGFVGMKLLNAFSREGIEITAAKGTSGKMNIVLQGHVSINAQNIKPFEFYSTVNDMEETSA